MAECPLLNYTIWKFKKDGEFMKVTAIPTSVTFLFDTTNNEAVTARFNWVTSDMTIHNSVLNYAKKDGFNGTFTETMIGESTPIDQRDLFETFTGQNKNEVQLIPIISHKAVTGVLEPDTEYVYSVGDGGVNVTDTVNPPSFRTPADDVDEFSFLWITDAQGSGIDVETVYRKYEHYLGRAVKTAFNHHPISRLHSQYRRQCRLRIRHQGMGRLLQRTAAIFV